jgi:hypothetical protein
MDGITWEEPPGKERRNWHAIAKVLRANPRTWARVEGAYDANHAHYINSAKSKAFEPKGSFQAMLRKGHVYARYIGVEK